MRTRTFVAGMTVVGLAATALFASPAATAATSGLYIGKARGPSTAPVAFRVANGRTVRSFKLSEATLNCGSFGRMTDTFAGPTMTIRNNQFKGLRRYELYRFVNAEVSVAGSFRGRRATGVIEVDAAPCLSSFRFAAVWRRR